MEASMGEMADLAFEPLVKDEVTQKLVPKIKALAEKLKEAKRTGRFVLLRFHHDADGISGAFALSEILRLSAYQQNSAVYSVKDAVRDLSNLSHEEKPLVILLDFGLNEQSAEGLALLKAAGMELVVIDHHPPFEKSMKIADFFLTPWEFSNEEDASKYVAGYLASEVARACGFDAEEYAKTACAGDKSNLLGQHEIAVKRALVLDFLAANSSFGNNLRFYRSVLAKEELFSSMYSQANERIDEAADAVMRELREVKAGETIIYVVKLERVVRKGEFPNASKITTRIHDRLKRETPLMILGICGRSVIMRLNDAAITKGLAANSIAERLMDTMKDFVHSGGGHKKAGAIRVEEGYSGAVVEEIIRIANR